MPSVRAALRLNNHEVLDLLGEHLVERGGLDHRQLPRLPPCKEYCWLRHECIRFTLLPARPLTMPGSPQGNSERRDYVCKSERDEKIAPA